MPFYTSLVNLLTDNRFFNITQTTNHVILTNPPPQDELAVYSIVFRLTRFHNWPLTISGRIVRREARVHVLLSFSFF